MFFSNRGLLPGFVLYPISSSGLGLLGDEML